MSVPANIPEWKKIQRAELLNRRQAVNSIDHQRWSDTITKLLEQGFSILQNLTVGFYFPYKAEFDPLPFINFLQKHGTLLALPVVVQNSAPLEFHEWTPDMNMKEGMFGLPIPANRKIVIPDAILIPAVGFGEQGDRLGYGGGFFDRTLAAMNPQPLKIALAFELSRLPTTYPQTHDILMDFVVTEKGIHIFENGKLEVINQVGCAIAVSKIIADRQLSNKK